MKNKKLLFIVGVVIIIVVIVIGIRLTQEPVQQVQVIRVGAVLPLTGSASDIGGWQKNGIDLAVDEINHRSGINGRQLQVVYEDSKSDPRNGTLAFTKLIAEGGVPCVLSSLSSVSNAVLPIANDHRIVLVMLAVSLPGIADRSEWAFRFNVGSDDEALAMARLLATNMGKPKVAVYYINDEFGRGAVMAFRKAYGGYRGEIVWEQSYEKDQTDHRSTLTILKSKEFDGIYVIGYVKASVLAIKQFRELGIKSPVYANMALTVPVFVKLAGNAIEGAYFTTNLFDPDAEEPIVKSFAELYRQRFGEKPSFFSAFAYDAIKMVAKAIETGGYISIGIQEALLQIQNYPGVTGDISVMPNGDAKFPVRIVKVQDGKVVEVVR
jgi:branched-chain amino acid transport system substrate-binding protein